MAVRFYGGELESTDAKNVTERIVRKLRQRKNLIVANDNYVEDYALAA